VQFARIEGVLPAPEANHAVRGAIDEALRCKEEGVSRTILFNLCGHGHFDMQAYIDYMAGRLEDRAYDDAVLSAALAGLPPVAARVIVEGPSRIGSWCLGVSFPLPHLPAKVSPLNAERPLSLGGATTRRVVSAATSPPTSNGIACCPTTGLDCLRGLTCGIVLCVISHMHPDGIIAQGCDGFQGHIAGSLNGPFVVLLERDGAHEADDGLFVGKDADALGAPLDLAVEALDRK
jgi:hypothetical protein